MPSRRSESRRAASLRYYYRNKEKILAAQEAKRREAGVEPRKPGMTPEEKRTYYRERATRERRAKGIKPRTKRSPEEQREAERLRAEKRRAGRPKRVRKTSATVRSRAIEQPVARHSHTVEAAGSSPARATKSAPAVVRNAWAKADPNSQIRKKWPTAAALQKAADEGAFDDVRTYI